MIRACVVLASKRDPAVERKMHVLGSARKQFPQRHIPRYWRFCYHQFVPATPFSTNVGLCKRCKRKLATLGSYCEPCFFAIVEAMDSDEPELDPSHEDDAPVIQLRNEES